MVSDNQIQESGNHAFCLTGHSLDYLELLQQVFVLDQYIFFILPVDPATGAVLPVNIVDGGGNGYVVDKDGKVTKGGSGEGKSNSNASSEAEESSPQ